MTFPVALDDVASIIEEGSAERAEFEASAEFEADHNGCVARWW